MFCSHHLVLIKRAELGMLTSAGKTVDPLTKMFSIGSLTSDPEKRIRLVSDPTTGQLVPQDDVSFDPDTARRLHRGC